MRKNSREDWNKPIQELIHMMNEDYPNGYELVITTTGAEIRSTLTDMVFTDDSLTAKLRSMINPEECQDVMKKTEHICERCKYLFQHGIVFVCTRNGYKTLCIPPYVTSECDECDEFEEVEK